MTTSRQESKILTDEEKKAYFTFLGKVPDNKTDRELSFSEILNKYLVEIAKTWTRKSTIESCANDFKNIILKALKTVTERLCEEDPEHYKKEDMPLPLSKCRGEFFFAAIEEIKRKSKTVYSKERLARFRFYYKRVVEVAAGKGICSRFLYGFTPKTITVKKNTESNKSLLPKSLTPLMNAIIFFALTTAPEKMDGEWAGLFLMYAFGLRNSESVSVLYEDLDSIRGADILWIFSSAEARRSVKSKPGGKTPNAFRGIVAPRVAVETINRRRRAIEAEVQKQHPDWTAEKVKETVGGYRIACHGNKYESPISPAQLTDAGRDFFSRINCKDFSEDDFYLASQVSYDREYMESTGFDFKDPTAYLFRREYGTVLKILGFSQEMREFLMGHLILMSIFTRNDFLNSPLVQIMSRLMLQRPLLNKATETTINVAPFKTPYRDPVMPNDVYRISASPDPSSQVLIGIEANEPGDHFSISASTEQKLKTSYFLNQNNHEQPNILIPYQKVMLKAAEVFSDSDNGKKNLKAAFHFPFSLDD